MTKSKVIRCWNCGESGHIKPECPKKTTSAPRSKPGAHNVEKKSRGKALLVALGVSTGSSDLFVDSGATAHMTLRKDWLINYCPNPGLQVTVANDKKLMAEGIGDVAIRLSDGDYDITTISNVMYVPNLRVNLLSVSMLVSRGYVVVFDSNGCKIFHQEDVNVEGETDIVASNFGGIFRLNVVEETANVASDKDSFRLWHKRLGHLSQGFLIAFDDNFNQQKQKE
ncbi:hypothetical protein J437_LFUL005137 [Ladona fulva]|uniref:CCHC-type domain-containing protein n=1 Tax=Ladona fulva TaxID=123851 RepID=A0A8K0P4Z6_LADFU|nr:hypothetical protein J437_LFUL005137 [Ladona fulva]